MCLFQNVAILSDLSLPATCVDVRSEGCAIAFMFHYILIKYKERLCDSILQACLC